MLFTPAQLSMYRALNKVMQTNQQQLESKRPENWEDAPEWSDLVTEVKKVKINWAVQQQQQYISSLIQL